MGWCKTNWAGKQVVFSKTPAADGLAIPERYDKLLDAIDDVVTTARALEVAEEEEGKEEEVPADGFGLTMPSNTPVKMAGKRRGH